MLAIGMQLDDFPEASILLTNFSNYPTSSPGME